MEKSREPGKLPEYARPQALSYFLFDDCRLASLELNVIKQIQLSAGIGDITLYIIGSSHAFHWHGQCVEVLSCKNISPKQEGQFLLQQRVEPHCRWQQQLQLGEGYRLEACLHHIVYGSPQAFAHAERQLLQSPATLRHAFEKDSALTVLHWQETRHGALLETWHTYPEVCAVVYSRTRINKI